MKLCYSDTLTGGNTNSGFGNASSGLFGFGNQQQNQQQQQPNQQQQFNNNMQQGVGPGQPNLMQKLGKYSKKYFFLS